MAIESTPENVFVNINISLPVQHYKKIYFYKRMVTIETFRKIALSFPEATEEVHFEKTSYRVKKKIFATYDHNNNRACIKLSEIDQDVFSSADKTIIYPVDNKWGKQGWTIIEMKKVNKNMFIDALKMAYCETAPKKLATLINEA